jgi:hypothetical protein
VGEQGEGHCIFICTCLHLQRGVGMRGWGGGEGRERRVTTHASCMYMCSMCDVDSSWMEPLAAQERMHPHMTRPPPPHTHTPCHRFRPYTLHLLCASIMLSRNQASPRPSSLERLATLHRPLEVP